MLKGLEIQEINFHTVNSNNRTFRIDSTYFDKKAFNTDIIIKQKPYFFLKDKEVVSGPFGSTLKSESYLSYGIPFVRIENIKGGFDINKSVIVYISEENNQLLKNSQLFIDDLVLSKVGNSIGYYARVDEEIGQCNISENNLGIKLQAYEQVLRHYILTYFNCKYGFDLTLRRISGNAQPKLNVFDITEIPIPIFSNNFYKSISSCILLSKDKISLSKKTYADAETLLLETLGLNNFVASKEPINIKSFKDSFLTTGRLDAEYYQKKYEDYISLIKAYSNGFDILLRVCNLNDKNYNPEDNTEYKYIELADIGKSGEITGCTTALGGELPSRARRKVFTNDVVISSIEGSLGSCALVTEDYNNALCSTGFYVINSDKINSETLLVLFKSEPMQNILKQNCSGTILTAINKNEFQNIPVPIIDISKQEKIAGLVEESFKLKKQSETLLETAKRAVEVAIEKGEDMGMEVIKKT